MTIRLPHWIARLFRRDNVKPWPEVQPAPVESELQALRSRIKQLTRELEIVRAGSRSMDVLAIRMADNVKATHLKYRLVKKNYVALKINTAQMIGYLRKPGLLANMEAEDRKALQFVTDHIQEDSGVVDPWLMTSEGMRAINRGEFRLQELQPLLAICPDFDADADKIRADVNRQIAESMRLTHNPETSTTEQPYAAGRTEPDRHTYAEYNANFDWPESDGQAQGQAGEESRQG